MDAPKRKFRSDINTKNIDDLIEKRQRKRFSKPKNSPYSKHDISKLTTSSPAVNKSGGAFVIQGIPREMLPKNKKSLVEPTRRDYDKPEHWIAPKKETKQSRDEICEAENKKINKSISTQSVRSYAHKLLLEASRQKRGSPSGCLTAKGYISRRIEGVE